MQQKVFEIHACHLCFGQDRYERGVGWDLLSAYCNKMMQKIAAKKTLAFAYMQIKNSPLT